jgi:phage-related protein
MSRTVIFYKTGDGKCPVKEFLDALPGRAAQKVAWVLNLLEDLDIVPSSYFKKLVGTEDIWECRIQFGSNAYRIFCFFFNNSVVLTHGFVKKSQKTPAREIERAEAYRRDFFKRRI